MSALGISITKSSIAHSVVLLAICNANYEFILVDIGDFGRHRDDSVYANSHMGFCNENK